MLMFLTFVIHLFLIVRLKMAEKKKTELAQKSRKEIAEYLNIGKLERAKIRVEHIIREDYLVEVKDQCLGFKLVLIFFFSFN